MSYHVGNGLIWVRIPRYGHGIAIKDTRKRPALFSERNGRCRMITIGPYIIRHLPPTAQDR